MPEIYRELEKLAESDMYPFHMPGHKRNVESTPMKGAFRCDITEIDGYDNLHDEKGIILEAEERANKLYGADKTFFLVNGSTSGVLSAISAVVPDGGCILAARGSHKSFYNVAYLRHLKVYYLPYKLNKKYGIPEVYTSDDVAKELDLADEKKTKISAVFITSPTYEGKCSDIKNIAFECHKRGIPLIVDAAHGAHFGLKYIDSKIELKENEKCDKEDKEGKDVFTKKQLYPYNSIPEGAVTQGADIVIHSVHKTLPSMTQTALLHITGDLVDAGRIKRFLRIYQTSSPSYVLMASIDLCIKEMFENAEIFVEKMLEYRNRIHFGTINCKNLVIPAISDIQDASKVVIYVKNATMTGQKLYDILREEYNLQLEMAGEKYALAIITGWDTDEGINRLITAICEIDNKISHDANEESKIQNANEVLDSECEIINLPERGMSVSEAWDAEKEELQIDCAEGHISGEFINLYPPGIPIIVPGERFEKKILNDIKRYYEEGLNLQGLTNRKGIICVKQK